MSTGIPGDVMMSFAPDSCPALYCVRNFFDFKVEFPTKMLKRNLGNFVAIYDKATTTKQHVHDSARGMGKVKEVIEKTKRKVDEINAIAQ